MPCWRVRRWVACVAASSAVFFATAPSIVAGASSVPPEPVSVPAVAAVPATPTEDEVRLAKAGLGWFLLANVDRPTRIADPCPTLSGESMGWYLAGHGLVGSDRDVGAQIVWDTDVGGGLIVLACGVDLSASASPEGSVAWSLRTTLLDGQATFTQYAVELAGRDAVIERLPELRAQRVTTCEDNGRRCTTAVEIDNLVLTVHLRGLPAETGRQTVEAVAVEIIREVVGNLGAVPPPT